jgi:hypothetical protein
MSQGLKISEFPEVTNSQLDNRDLFLVSEYVRNNVYASKKLSAKYLLNLKTEAVNLATVDKTDKELYAGVNIGSNGQSILKFRTIKAGTDINLDQQAETVVINNLIDGQNLASQADNSATIFFKKENSALKFKTIVGEQGILTRSDNNKVYIRPKQHHYFFIPGNPSNPSSNKKIFSRSFAYIVSAGGTQEKLTTLTGSYTTGTRTASLASIINACPIEVKDSIAAADRGLALVRMYLNTNSGGNVGHSLHVKSTEDKDWTNKISIDPTGGGGAAWEGEDTCTSIVEFNKTSKEFNWKIDVGTGTRTSGWEFSVTFTLEGFFV